MQQNPGTHYRKERSFVLNTDQFLEFFPGNLENLMKNFHKVCNILWQSHFLLN